MPDLHGSTAGALAGTTLVSATRYDGWGMTLAVGSAGGSAVAPGRFGYQGRMDLAPEAPTRLYEAGAREYAPGLGTFTALDPVIGHARDPRSMHRYLYAHANPASLVDPDGHAALPACDTDRYDFCHPVSIPVGSEPNGNAAERVNPPPRWTPPSIERLAGLDFVGMSTYASSNLWQLQDFDWESSSDEMVLRWWILVASLATVDGAPYGVHEIPGPMDLLGPSDAIDRVRRELGSRGGSAADYLLWIGTTGSTRELASLELDPFELPLGLLSIRGIGGPKSGGPGAWTGTTEVMSRRAATYQQLATAEFGGTGSVRVRGDGRVEVLSAYRRNGVDFDAYDAVGGRLIDTKGLGYEKLMRYGFGIQRLVRQAQRQERAAGSTPILWRFAERGAADTVRAALSDARVRGITVEWWAP